MDSPRKNWDALKEAKAVDQITREEFQKRSRSTPLPNPSVFHNVLPYAATIAYNQFIDGRIVAVRLLDQLVESGCDYHIARPRELDDSDFRYQQKQQGLIPDWNQLELYAQGVFMIVDAEEQLQFTVFGACENSKYINIVANKDSDFERLDKIYGGLKERLTLKPENA